MSSRVGTDMPASRSTALSSSGVGLNRSIQTAFSGSAPISTATAFLTEKSEGTKTENIQNSGTDDQKHNGLTRFWQALDDRELTDPQYLWRRGGTKRTWIRPMWPNGPITGPD